MLIRGSTSSAELSELVTRAHSLDGCELRRHVLRTCESCHIRYIHYKGSKDAEKEIPQLNKEFVPNDLDCILPDDGFNMDQFLHCLHRHGFECEAAYNLDRGYLLVLDQHRLPFTIDLISSGMASIFQRYSIVDMDVNNLCIGKDCKRALGMRSDLTRNNLKSPSTLETIVENIKQKHFTVLHEYDIENRVERMVKRGWTQVAAKPNNEYEYSPLMGPTHPIWWQLIVHSTCYILIGFGLLI